MTITVINGEISELEQKEYINYLEGKYQRNLQSLEITVDGDYVDLNYAFSSEPFERIRRITGYLVGTVDRFNNAKRAEERERVKHDAARGAIGRIQAKNIRDNKGVHS